MPAARYSAESHKKTAGSLEWPIGYKRARSMYILVHVQQIDISRSAGLVRISQLISAPRLCLGAGRFGCIPHTDGYEVVYIILLDYIRLQRDA